MNKEHFARYVIGPALLALSRVGIPWSPEAETLLLGTALAESASLHYLHQLWQGGSGWSRGAKGLYQVEPGTHRDLWESYLRHRPALANHLGGFFPGDERLIWDLRYASHVCRLLYWRIPRPLPPLDPAALYAYYKRWYNTEAGASTAEKHQHHFADAIEVVRRRKPLHD